MEFFGNKPANVLVPVLLFIVLSPGLFLTIPPMDGGVFRSGQTSWQSVIVHAIIFALIYVFLRNMYPQYY